MRTRAPESAARRATSDEGLHRASLKMPSRRP